MATSKIESAPRSSRLLAGIDVGGTAIKLGLIDDSGRIVAKTSLPTASCQGPAGAVDLIVAWFHERLGTCRQSLSDISAIGIGTPGPLDGPSGLILNPSNLPAWWNFPIRDAIADATGCRQALLTNDANAAAFGEYWLGSGAGCHSLLLLTLGTGVGGGIVIGDDAIEGRHSLAAEIGHVVVDWSTDARSCGCGRRGHLEAYASATALVDLVRERLKTGAVSSLVADDASGQSLDALTIYQHAERSDALAIEIILSSAEYLARGIADALHLIDPELVVLGGAMNFGGTDSVIGRRFIQAVADQVRNLTFPAIGKNLKIVYASLGNDAGFIGAAGLAARRFSDRNTPTA